MSYCVQSRARGRSVLALSALVSFATLGVPRADAVITTFTDRTLWQAAAAGTGTIQNEDFETLPTGALPVGSNQLGLINLNIGLITATTSGASINGSPALGGIRDLSMNADDGMRSYVMTFGGPISAVGFDFAGASTGGIAVLIADGQRFDFGLAGTGFFGIVSTTPLPNVAIGDTSPGALPTEIYDSDNYSFVVIPEPTSTAMLAPAAMLVMRRRRRFQTRRRGNQ
jgi:hypothetical protein